MVDGTLVEQSAVIGSPVFTILYLGFLAAYIQTASGKFMMLAVCSGILFLTNPVITVVKGSEESYLTVEPLFTNFTLPGEMSGKGPTAIFREAGFDTTILGSKRIERAAARWREAYAGGVMHDYGEKSVSTQKKKDNLKQKQFNELKAEVELLKKQIELLGTCISLKNAL